MIDLTHSKLTAADIQLLEAQSKDTLLRWAKDLNRWRWPKEIPNEESPNIHPVANSRRHHLMKWVEDKYGRKEFLRGMWELDKEDMSKFDDFWFYEHECQDPVAIEAYHQRRMKDQEEERARPSCTGHARAFYGERVERKRSATGNHNLYSHSFAVVPLFTGESYVDVFNERLSFKTLVELHAYCEDRYRARNAHVFSYERDGNEYICWYEIDP